MPLEDDTKENIVSTKPSQSKKMKLSLSLDFRLLAGVLLAIIAVMLLMWKPWQAGPKANDRTITVTGQSTITSTPDEYEFSPIYEFKSIDKKTALSDMGKFDDEVVAKLKSLGVADSKIKLNSSGYSGETYLPAASADGTTTYSLSMTIEIADKSLAQKVQDYLVTTNPTGSVTPFATFSDAKTKQLQSQGRDKATKDARAKADQSAKNLGFKINGVKSVDDSGGFGGCVSLCPMAETMDAKSSTTLNSSAPSLSVQSGENQLDYSVKVVYYIH